MQTCLPFPDPASASTAQRTQDPSAQENPASTSAQSPAFPLSRSSSFSAEDPAVPGGSTSASKERFTGEAQALSYLSLDYGSDIIRRFHWTSGPDFDASRYTPLETPSFRPGDDYHSLASVSEDGSSSQVDSSSGGTSMDEHYNGASVLQGLRVSYDGTALERSFGYPPHLVGSSLQWWENRIHSDDKPRVLLSLKRALESENTRYWAESYRFRIYRPPPMPSSSRPSGARSRAPPSSNILPSSQQSFSPTQSSTSFGQQMPARPAQPHLNRTISTISSSSNNSSTPSNNSGTPTEMGDHYSSGSSSNSSTRRMHGQEHPEDYITVLDQLYITRVPGTRRPAHALGVMCSAEQRVKIAEALHSPRSALLRSLPKGGVSYIGSEIISTILQNTASGLFMCV